jgi:hypothetical protein
MPVLLIKLLTFRQPYRFSLLIFCLALLIQGAVFTAAGFQRLLIEVAFRYFSRNEVLFGLLELISVLLDFFLFLGLFEFFIVLLLELLESFIERFRHLSLLLLAF